MLLWTNTHTLFILGWIVIGSYIAGVAWRDKKFPSRLAGYGVLSVLISFLNPYFAGGVELPFYQFQFLQAQSAFKSSITEYMSPLDLASYTVNGKLTLFQPLLGFHLFLILSGCVFLNSLKRVQLHELVIWLLFGGLWLALTRSR